MSNVTFILTNWSYKQYNAFLEHVSKQQFRKAGYLVEEVVADWSVFDVPENAKHPIDHLSLDDASAIIHTLKAKTKEYVDSLDIENDVIVDLSKWKWDDFNTFQDVIRQGNLDRAIDMMLQVARLKKGHPKDGELNAIQGMALFTALQNKITRIFSGGN